MDIDKFERIARDPLRTRSELESMRSNALAKGQVSLAKIATDVLVERFGTVTRRGGGSTPTIATFRGRSEHFESGKDAYLWLIEQFGRFRKDALERYVALHKRAGVRSKGCRFDKTPHGLFPANSPRSGDPAHYVALPSGWYADINLNHKDKFATLLEISYVCSLEYGIDWDFRVTGATEELLDEQDAIRKARKSLDDLLRA